MKRAAMRPFRFPVWMIVLMMTILVNVVIAIDEARQLASGGASGRSIWAVLPALLVSAAVYMSFAGAVGYGLLYALRKTGTQRLANLHGHGLGRH